MGNINNASENPNSNIAFLKALSVELNEIRTVNEMILQKNADLFAQIATCEARQGYVNVALAEGERIAQEVTRNAEIRVENIMARAQKELVPQQEQIDCMEHELTELTEEMNLGALLKMKEESPPKVTEIASIRRGFSLREPHCSEFSDHNPQMGEQEIIAPVPQPVVRREFSLREPQHLDIPEAIPGLNQPEQNVPEAPPVVRREFSLREPQHLDIPEEIPGHNQPERNVPEAPPVVRREFSLREPQQLDIPIEIMESNLSKHDEHSQQSALQPENSLAATPGEEFSNYDLAMSLVEQNDSTMHLDAFVDVRYFAMQGEQTGPIQKYSWQVKIDVEVPNDNHEFVGYGKVSSAVTSTLLRYDDIVLNDVFPFTIIEPNPENIGRYFYNSIEDTVSLMELTLKEITVWDSQSLIIQVNKRKYEFDDLLQGDDILQDIRSRLFAHEQGEDTVIKAKLGYIFKK